jgi:hypothetical protein
VRKLVPSARNIPMLNARKHMQDMDAWGNFPPGIRCQVTKVTPKKDIKVKMAWHHLGINKDSISTKHDRKVGNNPQTFTRSSVESQQITHRWKILGKPKACLDKEDKILVDDPSNTMHWLIRFNIDYPKPLSRKVRKNEGWCKRIIINV